MTELYLFDLEGRASVYGIGTYINAIANCLCNRKIRITIVKTGVPEEECSVEITHNKRVIRIPENKINPVDFESKDSAAKYYRNVINILRRYIDCSLENIFHLNYIECYYLGKYLKEYWPQSKLFLTIHYFSWCFELFGNKSYFKSVIKKNPEEMLDTEKIIYSSFLFEKQLLELADKIICLSYFAQEIIISDYLISQDKTIVIYNGAKDEFTYKDKAWLKMKYHIPIDDKILLFSGRLDSIKGVHYLLEAMQQIREKNSLIKLYLVGGGNFLSFASRYKLWDCVIYCGRLEKEILYDMYHIADIGLLPSFHEQCSYSIIEMLMHGLPVIATNTTGLNEMVENDFNGKKIFLQEEGKDITLSVAELVESIFDIINNPHKTDFFVNNRKTYNLKYRDFIMNEKLASLYIS